MAPPGITQQASIARFLQPAVHHEEKTWQQQQQSVSQAYLWPVYSCQQILAAELGWPTPPSLRSWQQVQARQQISLLQLPQVYENTGSLKRQEVSILELQQQHGSHTAEDALAAVGYHTGLIHLCKVQELLTSAQQVDSCSHTPAAGAAAQVHSQLRTSAVAPGCVWTIDTEDKLISCCWAAPGGDFAEMATAGSQGVRIRRFAEGRHHKYDLRHKPATQSARFKQVRYLDRTAAYTVVALRQGDLMLWDCRAASQAVAQFSTVQGSQLLRTLPGGKLVLTATAEGEILLYDIRRISSDSSSSVVNFGGSRRPQQLIASFNVPARAEEAAAAAAGQHDTAIAIQPSQGALSNVGGSSSNTVGQPYRIHPYFRDLQLNPEDCNLVAYVRPDLQVGVFDLYQNSVLQQVCVAESVSNIDGVSAVQVDRAGQAAARCCWDSHGRIVYTHGLLKHCSSMENATVQLQPTIAAIDFGSWRNRRLRQDVSSHWLRKQEQPLDTLEHGSLYLSGQQQHINTEVNQEQHRKRTAYSQSVSGFMSAGIMCQGGQVQHLPLSRLAVPTELAACQGDGQLLLGTLQGDLLCLG